MSMCVCVRVVYMVIITEILENTAFTMIISLFYYGCIC